MTPIDTWVRAYTWSSPNTKSAQGWGHWYWCCASESTYLALLFKMQFCSWLLLSLLSYHITSIEGLFFWRPSSAFAKQPEYKASIGEYILQAFDGPAILEAHQAQPPTIQIKRMALAVSCIRSSCYSRILFWYIDPPQRHRLFESSQWCLTDWMTVRTRKKLPNYHESMYDALFSGKKFNMDWLRANSVVLVRSEETISMVLRLRSQSRRAA